MKEMKREVTCVCSLFWFPNRSDFWIDDIDVHVEEKDRRDDILGFA